MSSSTVVENRVVQMEFDNANFERNVKTSMSTLDRLKNALNFKGAAAGFDELSKASKDVSMDGLTKGVETAKSHFSAMEVVAITALSNITTTAMRAGERIVKSLTLDQVSGGFEEYELKMGSIQTMMAGTGASLEEITGYLNDLNTYSDKTIYSFADMTQNIGKFTNAGVKLKDAVTAIKGISNEAAVSGANAAEASRAMYNFAQALSAGYVKLIDWKSIENANMATKEFKQNLIDTAVEMGTLTKTSDGMYKVGKTTLNATKDFNDSLQKGWMTNEVLIKTLQDYADETTEIGKKATEAATKVRKFTQLMDTLKEAVGSGWAQTFEILLGDFNEATDVFTGLSDYFGNIIGNISNARNELLSGAFSTGFKQLTEQINNAGISTDDFTAKLQELAIQNGLVTKKMIKKAGSLEATFSKGWLNKDIILKTIDSFTGGMDKASDSTKVTTANLEKLNKIANQVIRGNFGNGSDRVKALTKAGYDYATVQSLVNNKLLGTKFDADKLSKTIDTMSDKQLQSAGYTKEQVKALRELSKQAHDTNTPLSELLDNINRPSGRELVIDSVKNAWSGLVMVLKSVRKAWSSTFRSLESSDIYDLLVAINNFSKGLKSNKDTADKLTRTFKGVFTIVKAVRTVIGAGLNVVLKLLSAVLGGVDDDILTVTALLGDLIVKVVDFLTPSEGMLEIINSIVSAVANGITVFKDWIRSHVSLNGMAEGLLDILTALYGIVTALNDKYHITDNIQAVLSTGAENLRQVYGTLGGGVRGVTNNIVEFCNTIKTAIQNGTLLETILDGLKSMVSKIVDGFKSLINRTNETSTAMAGLQEEAKKATNGVVETVGKMKDKVVGFMDKIKESINGDFFGQLLAVGLGASIMVFVKKIADLLSATKGLAASFSEGVENVLGQLSKTLKAFTLSIKAKALMNIAKAVLLLVVALAALTVLAKIDSDALWTATKVLLALMAALAVLSVVTSKAKLTGSAGMAGVGAMILGLAIGLGVLVKAFKSLIGVKTEDALMPAIILTGLIGLLIIALKGINVATAGMEGSTLQILAFAVAITLLVKAITKLAAIDLNNVSWVNWVALAGCIVGMIFVMDVCSGIGKNGISAAAAMIGMAVSLKLIISAIQDVADMDLSGMNTAKIALLVGIFVGLVVLLEVCKDAGEHAGKAGLMLAGVSVFILSMSVFINQIKGISDEDCKNAVKVIKALGVAIALIIASTQFVGENAEKSAGILLSLAGAMLLLSLSMIMLSAIKATSLLKAGVALAAVTAMLSILMAASSKATGSFKTILALAACLGALTVALAAVSFIPTKNLWNAVGALSAVMAMMSILIVASSKAKGSIASLMAIIAMLAVLTVCIGALAAIDGGDGNALNAGLGLAVTLAALTVAIVGLAVAAALLGPAAPLITAFGAALTVLGVGVLAIGTGLALASLALSAIAPIAETSSGALVKALTTVVTGVAKLIPLVAVSLATGITLFIVTIAANSAKIVTAITTLVLAIIVALETLIPAVINLGVKVISAFLSACTTLIPQIIDTGLTIIMSLLEGIRDNIQGIVEMGIEIVVNLINGIANKLPDLIDAGFNLIISFIEGLADAIETNTPKLIKAVKKLGKSILKSLLLILSGGNEDFAEKGVQLIKGFINGIKSKISDAVSAVSDLGSKVLGKLKSVLGIHSPSREAASIAKYFDEGFVKGLNKYAGKVSDASSNLGNSVLDSVSSAVAKASSLIQNGVDANPTIRPVVDLSDVEAGAGAISGLFNSNYGLGANIGAISASMNGRVSTTNDDVVDAITKLGDKLDGVGGDSYQLGNITYDDGSNVANAVQTLVQAAKIKRRV